MPNKYNEKYTREVLTEAVANSISIAGVLRYLGIPMSGGIHAHVSRRIKRLGLDTSHFKRVAPNKGEPSAHRLTPEQVLVVRAPGSPRPPGHVLRRALREIGVPYACGTCGIAAEWIGNPIILHVDHINANWLDNRKENLRFLCPNCHSQTPGFAGRIKNEKGAVAQRQEARALGALQSGFESRRPHQYNFSGNVNGLPQDIGIPGQSRSVDVESTPADQYTPGDRSGDAHARIRKDRIAANGTVTVRHGGRLYHIGVGCAHAGTRVVLLVQDLHIRIIGVASGALLRELILDPDRNYQPTGAPRRRPADRTR